MLVENTIWIPAAGNNCPPARCLLACAHPEILRSTATRFLPGPSPRTGLHPEGARRPRPVPAWSALCPRREPRRHSMCFPRDTRVHPYLVPHTAIPIHAADVFPPTQHRFEHLQGTPTSPACCPSPPDTCHSSNPGESSDHPANDNEWHRETS